MSLSSVELVFAGDIMLADLPGQAMANNVDPFKDFGDVLKHADAAIGNLECVVATSGKAIEKPWTFRAEPSVLKVLKRYFPVVSLANNHTGDFGHEAFSEQLMLLEKHGIRFFGGGRDVAHARRGLLLELNGLRIALLAYNDFKPRSFEAGPVWPGVAWAVEEQMAADIPAIRKHLQADLVIPFMHWGWEYEPANERQRKLARLLIDNGADVVVGGHPHVTQEIEYYKGRLIVYSLGNFVFDGFEPGHGRVGWLLRLRLNRAGLIDWDTLVAKIDDRGIPSWDRNAPSPAGDAASQSIETRIFASLNQANRP